MVTSWAVSQIDLSDPRFWGPFGERDAAFELLRRERPVAFFPEPAVPLLPPGPGFWALTRYTCPAWWTIPALRRRYPHIGWHPIADWAATQDWHPLLQPGHPRR